jgi:hypothetical protein
LRGKFDVPMVDGIKGMKKLKDSTGAAFDVAEDYK